MSDGTPTGARGRRRDFPGRRMVGLLSVTETVSHAALFYRFAVMVVPMRRPRRHHRPAVRRADVVGPPLRPGVVAD